MKTYLIFNKCIQVQKTNKQKTILTGPLSWMVERQQFTQQTGWKIVKRAYGN